MANVNTYDIGDRVKITGTFTTGGVNADPATVRAHYKDPSGTVTTYTYPDDAELVREAEGVYSFHIPVVREGMHYYRMDDGETGGYVATEGRFDVRKSNVL